jgi:hypothetical protein
MNLILQHVMRQRPSLFNYGTQTFVAHPDRLCHPIHFDPEVTRRGNPLVTREDPLPIPGTDGQYGLEFCAQLTNILIDFHPSNVINLPAELQPPLAAQRFALEIEVCGGISCPDPEVIDGIVAHLKDDEDPRSAREKGDDRPRPAPKPLPARGLDCFCIKLFAIGHFRLEGAAGHQFLTAKLDGLEIVDIEPKGLENSLECFLGTTIRLSLLPKLRIALDTLVFHLGAYATLSVSATSVSGDVPNNPAIEDDMLKVFVNVGVA